MKASTKGALLSGLVFPGVGQLALGNNRAGMAFILLTCAGIIFVIYGVIQIFQSLITNLLLALEQGSLSFGVVFEQTHLAIKHSDSLMINLSLLLLVGCWLVSIIHAILMGKKIDEQSLLDQ